MDERDDATDGHSPRAVREQLCEIAPPIDRTDRLPLSVAAGRVLATPVDARWEIERDGTTVEAGDRLFESGHRLRPRDVALLKAAGHDEVTAYQRPQAGVVPTGDELVQYEPGRGEAVETSGFAVTQYVDRWGGKVTYRDVVAEDPPALRMALQRDLTRDCLLVAGSAAGDGAREMLDELGEVIVDGVAIQPGGATVVGRIENRPVVLLPASPVGAVVATHQLVRPLVKHLGRFPTDGTPAVGATLTEPVDSERGVREFVPVRVDGHTGGESPDGRTAAPVRSSSLAALRRADGWVAVAPEDGAVEVGETVAVADWDAYP